MPDSIFDGISFDRIMRLIASLWRKPEEQQHSGPRQLERQNPINVEYRIMDGVVDLKPPMFKKGDKVRYLTVAGRMAGRGRLSPLELTRVAVVAKVFDNGYALYRKRHRQVIFFRRASEVFAR